MWRNVIQKAIQDTEEIWKIIQLATNYKHEWEKVTQSFTLQNTSWFAQTKQHFSIRGYFKDEGQNMHIYILYATHPSGL